MGMLTVPLKTYQLLWNIWRICSKSEFKKTLVEEGSDEDVEIIRVIKNDKNFKKS